MSHEYTHSIFDQFHNTSHAEIGTASRAARMLEV